MKIKNLFFYTSVAVSITILILSVIPGVGDGLNSGFEKHLTAYAVLSFSTGLFMKERNYSLPLLKGMLSAGLFGALIEFIQYFIPYRKCDIMDIAANFSGALLALIVSYLLKGFIAKYLTD